MNNLDNHTSFSRSSTREDTRGPVLPVAPRLPLLGSIPALLLKRYEFLERARERCGDVFAVDLGISKIVVVSDPGAAEEVLVQRSKNFDKGDEIFEGAREAIGNGLALSEGTLWRRQRRLMNPAFRNERVAGLRTSITEIIEQMLGELGRPSATETFDVSVWTSKLLATLTVRLLLGSELDPNTFAELRDALGVMLAGFLAGVVTRRIPRWVPIPGAARFEAARQTVDRIVLGVIAERRASSQTGEDLLGMLLAATDDEGTMSDQQLRDEVIITYIAGYDTTAWTLAWGLMLLAESPRVVADLQAELDAHEDLVSAPLLDATIREVMRLYPAAPLLSRRACVDETLLGYRIPAGTTVLVMPWLIHRNPRFWRDPLRFDPRRHLEPAERPRLAWMPFGAGQRTCIGKGLAMMEAKLALGMLLQRFTPLPGRNGRRSEPRLASTLAARDGVWIRLAERSPGRAGRATH